MDLIFLVGWLSTSPFNGIFTSSSNIFVIIKWFTFTCFFNIVIPFICSNFKVTKKDWIIITNNTSHDLWTFHINILVIIPKKEPQHKKIVPCDFWTVIWTCNFLMFYFIGFSSLFVWKLKCISHSCRHFFSITSFMNTSHVFSFIIFSFSKDWAIFNFTKNYNTMMGKKNE